MIQFKPLTLQSEWEWFKGRTSVLQCEDSLGIVAHKEGVIQAVCVADSFTVDACCVHFAIDNPMVIRSGFFHEVAEHLFHTCNRGRIFGLVPSNNAKALKLDTNMGFKEVARIPDGFKKGIDTVVLVMERETSRWLIKRKVQRVA